MQGGGYGDFRVDGYEIEGLLGAGPTGELWLARHVASRAHVGLKRLHPKDVDAHDEARRIHAVLGMLNHSSLLRVRELLSYGNDELVLVLDRSEGGTLDQLLMARPMLDPGEVVTVGATVAHALAAIHEHGLVHGDVTPESVVFTAEGQPLLTDVGLSGLVERWDVLGTHGYTDPSAGGSPESSGDIYGLAAVCYTALSGAPLDPEQQRRPLHQVNPGVPAALSHAIEAGLQPSVGSRPDAAAFAAQLDAAAPRSAVRFPDGGGGFTGLGSDSGGGGGQDSFVLGAGQAAAPSGGQQVSNPLFGLGGSGGGAFTPGAPSAQPQPPQQQVGFPAVGQAGYGPGGVAGSGVSMVEEDDEDEEDGRSGGGSRFPVRVLLIGIPSVLGLVLVVMVVSWLLPSGGQPSDGPTAEVTSADRNDEDGGNGTDGVPSEPERPEPELTGKNAQHWADVLNDLDDRRAEAFANLDKQALNQVYAPGSGLIGEESKFMDAIRHPSEAEVEFSGAEGLWTMLHSLEVLDESDERVELKVTDQLVDYMYVVPIDGPVQKAPTRSKGAEERRIVLIPDGDGGWLISEDHTLGQAN